MASFNSKAFFAEDGQVVLVIMLITAVLLTMGLSLASRTTQEILLSQQESESTRVFNAAETGIESALSQDFSQVTGQTTETDSSTIPDVSVETTTTPLNSLETTVYQGTAAHIDLTGLANGTPITISWGKGITNCADAAGILVSFYYIENIGGAVPKVLHAAYSPGPTTDGCRDYPDFTSITASAGGFYRTTTYILSGTGGLDAIPYFMRVRPLHNDTALRITGAGLPTQMYAITAQADNLLPGSNETRIIQVDRGLATAPSFMDYSVYSGAGIIQAAP